MFAFYPQYLRSICKSLHEPQKIFLWLFILKWCYSWGKHMPMITLFSGPILNLCFFLKVCVCFFLYTTINGHFNTTFIPPAWLESCISIHSHCKFIFVCKIYWNIDKNLWEKSNSISLNSYVFNLSPQIFVYRSQLLWMKILW